MEMLSYHQLLFHSLDRQADHLNIGDGSMFPIDVLTETIVKEWLYTEVGVAQYRNGGLNAPHIKKFADKLIADGTVPKCKEVLTPIVESLNSHH